MSFHNIFTNSTSNNVNQKNHENRVLVIPSVNKFALIKKSENRTESGTKFMM